MKSFDEIFIDKTKYGVKVQTSEYSEHGKHIIIDQGQSQIAGYTDREDGLFEEVPVVIFGDHTRVVKYVDEPFFLGADGVKVFRSKDESANYKYLFYALKNAKIPNTGYNRHFKWLKEVQINYPDSGKQTEIVDILDKLSNVIKKRDDELSALDDLIKARFVEMFIGKDYPLFCLDDLIIEKGEYGAQSASCEYDVNRPRYVRITDINEDGTLNDDVVSSSNIDDDKLYKLEYGDFLFARMGASVGKTYAYKSGNQIYAGYLIRYKLNTEKILPGYLSIYTKTDGYWNWVKSNQNGSAQPGINAKKYGTLQIPVAPIEEQIVFEEFVKQVDKSKIVVQKALDEAQLLFDSLMQEYFG